MIGLCTTVNISPPELSVLKHTLAGWFEGGLFWGFALSGVFFFFLVSGEMRGLELVRFPWDCFWQQTNIRTVRDLSLPKKKALGTWWQNWKQRNIKTNKMWSETILSPFVAAALDFSARRPCVGLQGHDPTPLLLSECSCSELTTSFKHLPSKTHKAFLWISFTEASLQILRISQALL